MQKLLIILSRKILSSYNIYKIKDNIYFILGIRVKPDFRMSNWIYTGGNQSTNPPTADNTARKICSCGLKFTRPRALTYHKKWECGQTLHCDQCGQSFYRLRSLHKHQSKCTNMLWPKNHEQNLNHNIWVENYELVVNIIILSKKSKRI